MEVWCNEEGIPLGLPINPALGPRFRVRGTYLIARSRGADLASLTDDDIAQLTATYDRERLIEEVAL